MLKIPSHLIKYEGHIQDLLIKAERNIKKAELTEYKFVNEYQEAVLEYFRMIFEKIGEGIAIALNVDPRTIKKSVKIPIIDLIKASNDDEEIVYFYKGLFDKLKEKLSVYKNFFKKFNFNRGKPLEPVKLGDKIKYNPLTGKAMTWNEWDEAVNGVIEFMGDSIGNEDEAMLVRNALMGKLIQRMESEGMKQKDIKKMSYDAVEKKYGEIPATIKEAKKQYNLSDKEAYALEYAKKRAGEYLSIKDGTIKNHIKSTMRKVIVEGIQAKKTPKQIASDLYWGDPSEQLGKKFKEDSINAWSRNMERIAVTEMKMAMQNGYLLANVESEPKGNKVYFVFDGTYNKNEKADEICNRMLGKIFLWTDIARTNDRVSRKDDEYADYYIFYDKTNAGRTKAGWWGTIPAHPWCKHFWSRINPTNEFWDEDLQTIQLKEI